MTHGWVFVLWVTSSRKAQESHRREALLGWWLRHWLRSPLEISGKEGKNCLQASVSRVAWLERRQGGTAFTRLYVGLALLPPKQLAKDVKFP